MVNEYAQELKALMSERNWDIDICEGIEPKDSEVLFEVFKDFSVRIGLAENIKIRLSVITDETLMVIQQIGQCHERIVLKDVYRDLRRAYENLKSLTNTGTGKEVSFKSDISQEVM